MMIIFYTFAHLLKVKSLTYTSSHTPDAILVEAPLAAITAASLSG
jgi:hypothetical protein